jgi:hypothetical protein
MRFKSLAALKRPELKEIPLGTLPRRISMARYASEKAFQINELVRSLHGDSLEWYGFTLGVADKPEFIVDIGLPHNDLNLKTYTALSPERIAAFQEGLPEAVVINGWIHSHGSLMVRQFSHMDERNHRVVMDFVAAGLRIPLAKREVAIRDLVFLLKDRFVEEDLREGSVSLITDAPIREASIMETIYGSFCYAIVVGDGRWHAQEILTVKYGVLSGHARLGQQEAEMALVDTGRALGALEISALRAKVEAKIRPNANPPLETMERM